LQPGMAGEAHGICALGLPPFGFCMAGVGVVWKNKKATKKGYIE
jgi:hypothetical protein